MHMNEFPALDEITAFLNPENNPEIERAHAHWNELVALYSNPAGRAQLIAEALDRLEESPSQKDFWNLNSYLTVSVEEQVEVARAAADAATRWLHEFAPKAPDTFVEWNNGDLADARRYVLRVVIDGGHASSWQDELVAVERHLSARSIKKIVSNMRRTIDLAAEATANGLDVAAIALSTMQASIDRYSTLRARRAWIIGRGHCPDTHDLVHCYSIKCGLNPPAADVSRRSAPEGFFRAKTCIFALENSNAVVRKRSRRRDLAVGIQQGSAETRRHRCSRDDACIARSGELG
jgi:hypothetical protein